MKEFTKQDIDRYVEYGEVPSGFVRAVLENEMPKALKYADDENRRDLPEILAYCSEKVPQGAWGDVMKVRGWIKQQGLRQYESSF